MADNHSQLGNEESGCGVFDFLKKKDDEKVNVKTVVVDVEMINEKKKEEEKPTETLQRSHNIPSSIEYVVVAIFTEQTSCMKTCSPVRKRARTERRRSKKKKGLKEKIEEKLSNEKEEKTQKQEESTNAEATHPDDKKGFLEKIKDMLPGQHKKPEDGVTVSASVQEHHSHEGDGKEKKGILEKIKEKLPDGHHQNEDKDKHKGN